MDIQVLILILTVLYIIRLVFNLNALLFILLISSVSPFSTVQANVFKSNQTTEIVLYDHWCSLNTIDLIKSALWKSLRQSTCFFMLMALGVALIFLRRYFLKWRLTHLEEAVNAKTCDILLSKNNRDLMIKETKLLVEDLCHQARNPLQFILANLTSLELNSISISDYIEKQQKEVNELTRLMDQILDIELINIYEGTTFKLNNISAKLKEMLLGFAEIAKTKGVKLDWQVEDNITLKCSLICIERLIENIISNSIRYTNKGEIRFEAFLENTYLVIICADTGIGIPEKDKNIIFNWRIKGSNNISNEGFGIGLAITKEVVNAHQGHLELISDEGKGTTITINIPIHKVSKQKPFSIIKNDNIQSQMINDGVIDKEVILVVESNLELLTYLKSILEPVYQVIVALDGASGLMQARKTLPDLIISDVSLESGDDFEFIRLIKRCEVIHHIPVILITSKSDKLNQIAGFSAGANDYIIKPFQEVDILNRIHNQLVLIKLTKKRALAPTPKQPSEDRVIANFLSYICKNYDKSEIQISDLSKALFISNKQLERKVKHFFGKTPNQYLNTYRLARAKDLLTSGQQPKNVYIECGFSSHTYFSRKFKEHYGHSPSFFLEK